MQTVELMDIQKRVEECCQTIRDRLSDLEYVEAVGKFEDDWRLLSSTRIMDGKRFQHIVLRIRMSKAGKALTRKRWGEVSKIVNDCARLHNRPVDVFASQMFEAAKTFIETPQIQGLIIIF